MEKAHNSVAMHCGETYEQTLELANQRLNCTDILEKQFPPDVSIAGFAGFAGLLIQHTQKISNVMELVSHRPANAPDNFRETTSRYFFSKQLVVHKDKTADRCYLQRTSLTRGDVERRMGNGNGNATSDFHGAEEEWIDTSRALPINHQVLRSVFGSEVAEFCRFEDVFYLREGSFGAASHATNILGLGPLSNLGRHKRSEDPKPKVVIIEKKA